MPPRRLLVVTASELTRDVRARRQVAAAVSLGLDVVGLSGQITGEPPVDLPIPVRRVGRRGAPRLAHESAVALGETTVARELRGGFRLLRLGMRTLALWQGGRALGRVDVVHANDLETLPAAWLLARRSRARLVYDAHELYSEFDADPPRLWRAAVGPLEGALARRADAVVTVSEPLAEELRRLLWLPAEPIVVLNAPAREPRDPSPRKPGPLRAVYQGAFGPGRPPSDLLDALAAAKNVALTIRVVRFPATVLQEEIRSRELGDRVQVAEPFPPDRLVEALASFDVGLIFDRPATRNNELSFPNKLFDYLMAGLAVAVPAFPGLAAFVEREGVGLTFEPGQPDALAGALEELAVDRARLAGMQRNARRVALGRYNAEAQRPALAQAWGIGGKLAAP